MTDQTGGTTGTAAAPGTGTYTLADLRSSIRKVLASTSDWTDGVLDVYIQDAIRFHSNYFPKRWRYTLTLTTGTQAYDLPWNLGFKAIVAVEYPTGETPQSYLQQANEWDAVFQNAGNVYAIIGLDDSTAVASMDAAGQIRFAETVTTAETAVIAYTGDHAVPVAGDDDAYITVPTREWEALVAFVEFRSHWELETDEAVSVTNVSIIMGQLGQEARMAWNRYKEVLTALTAAQADAKHIRWAERDTIQRRAY